MGRGVRRRLLDRDRGHAPFLPDQAVVRKQLLAEVEPGDLLQVVARLFGAGEVRGDHRVKRDPARAKAVATEDDQVVLQVLADDPRNLVLDRRSERGEHLFERKLRRRPKGVVPDRDVVPLAGLKRDGDPDDRGPHGIPIRRLEVERELLRRGEPLDEPPEVAAIEDRVEVCLRLSGPLRRPGRRGRKPKLAEDRLELKLPQELREPLDVRPAQSAVGGDLSHGDVVLESDQRLRSQGVARVGCQTLAHARVPDLRGILEHRLKRPELAEKLSGRLLPHPGDSGDVVRGVPDERQEVDDPLRRDAELLLGLFGIETLDSPAGRAAGRLQEGNPLTHELGEVLVRGGDVGREPLLLRATHQARQQVVRLHPPLQDDGHPETLQEVLDHGKLRRELLRHLLARRLVRRVDPMPKGLPAGVEDHGGIDPKGRTAGSSRGSARTRRRR